MDREISKEHIQKRRRKWVINIGLLVLFFASSFAFIPRLMQSSVNLKNYRLGTVSRGSVSISIETTGHAIPMSEALITSPVSATVRTIDKQVGDTLNKDDAILTLDTETEQLKLNKLTDELKLLQSNIQKTELEIEKSRSELQYKLAVDSVQMEQMKANIKNEEHLNSIGGSSQETIKKLKNQLKVSQLSFQNLKHNSSVDQKLNQLELNKLRLQKSIKQSDIQKQQKILESCIVRTFGKGVLTELNCQIGQNTPHGTALAKVANLEYFKIVGKVPNRYASDMRVGQEVVIRYDTTEIRGQVSGIVPSADNGSVEFTVHYGSRRAAGLMANMRVKLNIVKSKQQSTLRLPYGDYYEGRQQTYIFVLEGGELRKRKVKFGGASDKFVEVISGLQENEEVVLNTKLSQKYPNSERLKINNN